MDTMRIAKQVFGAALPAGATSFSTDGCTATFCIGRTGELVDVPFTDSQAEVLRNNGMLGSFGVELVERQGRASNSPAP